MWQALKGFFSRYWPIPPFGSIFYGLYQIIAAVAAMLKSPPHGFSSEDIIVCLGLAIIAILVVTYMLVMYLIWLRDQSRL